MRIAVMPFSKTHKTGIYTQIQWQETSSRDSHHQG